MKPPAPRRGRPPIPPSERRERHLAVRLSTPEWLALRDAAHAAGVTPAEYVRAAIAAAVRR